MLSRGEKQEVEIPNGGEVGQDVRNGMAVFPSCTLLKAVVKLGVGRERRGDAGKCQICMV